MSVLKRILIDPFTAKSTLSKLKSVSLAASATASYSTRSNRVRKPRVRKPADIKEVESMVAFYEKFIPEQLSRSRSVQDIVKASPSRVPQLIYQRATTKTGWEDPFLEKKLERLSWTSLHVLEWMLTRKPSSLVTIFLKFMTPASVDMITPINQLRKIHALAVRTGMTEDEENLRSLMKLYMNSGDMGVCERIFQSAASRGLILYNQMLGTYAVHDTKKAERFFFEMIRVCPPNDDTYAALLHGFSCSCKPDKAIELIRYMKRHGVHPQPRHYRVLVDSLARMMKPDFINEAIDVLKAFPAAQSEVTINGILSRCVPPPGVESVSAKEELELKETIKRAQLELEETIKRTQDELELKETIKRVQDLQETISRGQDVLDLQETIRHAQHLVDYLKQQKFKYSVLNTTHWRLAKCGLKWPGSVKKK